MSNEKEVQTGYFGTYFDRAAVMRVSRWAEISAWVVAIVYGLDLLVAVSVFVLQNVRGFWVGMGPTDYAQNILFLIERPFRGIAYFIALQAIGKVLLILMDLEDNTRRAARK